MAVTVAYLPEGMLTQIEPELALWSEDLGLPYIRPSLSAEGRVLILESPFQFCERYVRELHKVVHDNFNYVQV